MFLCFFGKIYAQKTNEDIIVPPKNTVYPENVALKIKEVYRANKHKIPKEKALKEMATNPNLPENLNEILQQFDWLEVAQYFFHPETPEYTLNDVRYNYLRHNPSKGLLEFEFMLPDDQQPTLTFMNNNANGKEIKEIRKMGTQFYYYDKTMVPQNRDDEMRRMKDPSKAYSPVVEYKDKLLVIDITFSAELGSAESPTRFRKVFMAIPKFFSLGEPKNPVVSNPKTNNANTQNVSKNNISVYDDNTIYTKDQLIENGVPQKIKEVYKANKHKVPNEQTLKNMPLNTNLPNNLTDILYQNDWLEVARYMFSPEDSGYSGIEIQNTFKRFHSTKGILTFRFRLPNDQSPYPPRLEYVDNETNVPVTIRKNGTHFYYQDNKNEKDIDYSPMVDYKDGIMIIDFTESAKLNDFNNVRRSRSVFMAIPKFFSLGEQKNPVVYNQKPDNTTINNTTKINTNSNDKRLVNVSDAYDDNATYTKNQPIENGVAEKIKEVYNANKHKIPNEQALKNMSLNTNLPNNLTDILYQTDWLEVGNYFFHPTEPGYSRMRTETRLRRFHSTKGILAFRFKLPDNDIYPPVVEYVDEMNGTPVIIQKTGTHFYYQDNRKPEVNRKISYKPVVDYKDGILIVDFTYSEALNDFNNVRRFRQVLMAIPKQF
ncbi:MAG: hypothetical protein EAZ44_02955 [Cytophagia bacterium]|nr:MAG: hypothetical protein EAZ44_02955 [Cytophagia bacterium]TAG43636.1 MAG: hypothetical protein EAZ31_03790 [Cytophagia bacterium]